MKDLIPPVFSNMLINYCNGAEIAELAIFTMLGELIVGINSTDRDVNPGMTRVHLSTFKVHNAEETRFSIRRSNSSLFRELYRSLAIVYL